jgi:hypothetical protein
MIIKAGKTMAVSFDKRARRKKMSDLIFDLSKASRQRSENMTSDIS